MSHNKIKVQFILKHRDMLYTNETECEGQYSNGILHSGLFNSAGFVSKMLNTEGYHSELVHVADNNCIDREVTRYKPDIVIIEAFWVVPEKFDVLVKLHPKVKFIIRNHSKIPFLANEGIAFDWALRYSNTDNVFVSSNSFDTNNEMMALIGSMHPDWNEKTVKSKCPYLPNYYPLTFNPTKHFHRHKESGVINIGCFGAIRPLKNQMMQAVAAIKFADMNKLKLKFHINGNRVEGNGNQVLKNIRNLFTHLPHELVEHEWMPHNKFIDLVTSMDMGMQVSYTETFNIVAADMILNGVPMVVSKEIFWVESKFYADPNSCSEIVEVLDMIHQERKIDEYRLLKLTYKNMEYYDRVAIQEWKNMIANLTSF